MQARLTSRPLWLRQPQVSNDAGVAPGGAGHEGPPIGSQKPRNVPGDALYLWPRPVLIQAELA